MADVATAASKQTWAVPRLLFASLPWYDLPEIRESTDAFWEALASGLRKRGVDGVPSSLDRNVPYGFDWNGKCLFTQTCGYPLFTTSRAQFHVLAIPAYDAPGCQDTLHRAFIVVRASSKIETLEDLRGGTFAINEPDSNSGMNLARHLFAPLSRGGRFFSERIVSGSHIASVELIRTGAVNAAAVDCVTFALLQRYRPAATAELRVIAQTAMSPAPPFATSARGTAAVFTALRSVLLDIMRDPRYAGFRNALLLKDVELGGTDVYGIVLAYEREAESLGYPALA